MNDYGHTPAVMGHQARRVLVIDSSPLNRKFVSVNLIKRGHTVLEADNCIEGITLLREPLPSIIILEIEMEDEGGMALLSHLATHLPDARIPVVLFTTSPVNVELVRRIYPHITTVLTKPIDARTLLSALASTA